MSTFIFAVITVTILVIKAVLGQYIKVVVQRVMHIAVDVVYILPQEGEEQSILLAVVLVPSRQSVR